ncbi:MAG: hypothetical protein V3S69_01655, partial [Dehalococcoidales bacterium]
MADASEVFRILENADESGAALPARSEGDTVSANQVGVLPCKDSSGNEAKIPLDADGKIPVSLDSVAGTAWNDHGDVAGAKNSDTTVAAYTMTASKKSSDIRFHGSATKATLWKLVHHNNGVDTILDSGVSGPGSFSFHGDLKNIEA